MKWHAESNKSSNNRHINVSNNTQVIGLALGRTIQVNSENNTTDCQVWEVLKRSTGQENRAPQDKLKIISLIKVKKYGMKSKNQIGIYLPRF